MQVLIVDDDRDQLQSLGSFLRTVGCDVLLAHNAERALELVARHHPDVAICDWDLGPGTDGIHVAETLVSDHRVANVVLMSGHPLIELQKKAKWVVDVPCLHKPIYPEELLDILGGRLKTSSQQE